MDERAQGRPDGRTSPRLDLLLAGVALVAGGVAAAMALPHDGHAVT